MLGFVEKREHRCTTTILPICNDTIIVFKITLLNSVFFFTIFVIPKRDRKTKRQADKQIITFFRLQRARDPRFPAYLSR